jgi:lysozyme family protein
MKSIGKQAIAGFTVAIAALTVALVTGCGGSSSSSETTTTTEANAADWANGLCTATNTYVDSLKSLGDTLKGGSLSKDSLNSAVDQAKAATQTFADDVEALGSPPVSDSQAKQIADDLQSELAKDADAIKSATDNVSGVSDIVAAVTSITATLTTAGTQISTAVGQLKQLDAKDELQQAFQTAPACKTLLGSGS